MKHTEKREVRRFGIRQDGVLWTVEVLDVGDGHLVAHAFSKGHPDRYYTSRPGEVTYDHAARLAVTEGEVMT